MPTLIIDNYDSFTCNLVDAAARITGCAPIVIRNDECSWADLDRREFESVIISPGPGNPANQRDFGISRDAIRSAHVPVLGVCLGHQGIALEFGGKVVPAPEPVHGRSSRVFHCGDTLFNGIPNEFSAVRYHSLMVDETLPATLRKIAWTGGGIVMAIRHTSLPIWGVQFHPESICTEFGDAILRNFLFEARHSAPRCVPVALSQTRTKSTRRRVFTRSFPLNVSVPALFRELFAQQKYAFWLDSAQTGPRHRFSFLGSVDEQTGEILEYDAWNRQTYTRTGSHRSPSPRSLWQHLDEAIRETEVDGPALPFPFTGGYVGYLGYEAKSDCGAPRKHRSSLPDAAFLFVDRFLAIDHQEQTVWLVGCVPANQELRPYAIWLSVRASMTFARW